jgi:hypothetical protein
MIFKGVASLVQAVERMLHEFCNVRDGLREVDDFCELHRNVQEIKEETREIIRLYEKAVRSISESEFLDKE